MSANFTYNRLKSATTNSTDINVSWEQRETDGTRAAIAAGTTGIAELHMRADADESGGADIQDIFRITATPVINVNTGKFEVRIEVVPILGDGTDGVAKDAAFVHDENMDAWQTAAGRARQA